MTYFLPQVEPSAVLKELGLGFGVGVGVGVRVEGKEYRVKG